jgi:hypothetical protein
MHIHRFHEEIMEQQLKNKIQNIKIDIKKKTDRKANGNRRIQQKGLEETFFKLKDPGKNNSADLFIRVTGMFLDLCNNDLSFYFLTMC